MKPHLLISYGNAYIFHEVVYPTIKELSNDFNVYVILSNGFVNSRLKEDLQDLKNELKICEFIYIESEGLLGYKKYLRYSQIIEKVKNWNIDLILGASETSELNRSLILNFSNKPFCTLWTALGYNLLDQNFIDQYSTTKQYWKFIQYEDTLNRQIGLKSWLTKQYLQRSLLNFLTFLLKEMFKRSNRKLKVNVFNKARFFLEKLIRKFHKVELIKLGKVAKLTKISNNMSSHHFFVDDFEKETMSKILTKGLCSTITYPTYKLSKSTTQKSEKLLFILTTGYSNQNTLPITELIKIQNELTHIMQHSKTKSIDLKPHPREKSTWVVCLQEHLISCGINTKILPKQMPFRDILTQYKAVTGFASSSFRDIKYQNPDIQIYGMERISIMVAKTISQSSKLNIPNWFGYGEGINWLRVDGAIYTAPQITEKKATLKQELLKALEVKYCSNKNH
ncbi:polysialyltransferase family glycosyltransferase [Halobacteriovorax sp. HLS]|uniref:polysialyltransferase family glycosyltransferase n=1 Tax=Halobacteriovorax sp. HLS TaxID=2234000 RepID=UPI000FD7208D|nr:polysialyltransferase family glycosyltransferase [Halobacteriovorax sp. HLS]